MILTYKIKHYQDFKDSLIKAKQVADFAVKNKFNLSSASVKYIGLKSMIACQILRKYGRNRKTTKVKSVKLTIPNQGIFFNKTNQTLKIPCVNIRDLKYYFANDFVKINQVEIDGTYCYVAVTYEDAALQITDDYIGVDLNTTGHCAVVANPKTGKVIKLGKKANHFHQKYKNIRKKLQEQGKLRLVKKIKNRESRIIKDLNHKISKKIVDIAVEQKSNIKLEDLEGIRGSRNKKVKKTFRYALNSWSFYQLRWMIEYKAKKLGVVVTLIEPAYTSQNCSRCGSLGERNGKLFKCLICGHIDHADSNASFNISIRVGGRLNTDRDVFKGRTDTPIGAILGIKETPEPQNL